VVAIPTIAIQRGQGGLFVWVVNADNIVEARPVTTAAASGDLSVIDKGLDGGERVVTDGQYKLQPDARVSVIASTAAVEGPK
jgi:membrane fusion protein, multidrug efflux system